MTLKEIIDNKVFKTNLNQIDINNAIIINTINAHSYCLSKSDFDFAKVLEDSDVLLPDGSSIVMASIILLNKKINKIAGADVHHYLLEEANKKGQKIFYLGTSDETLQKIEKKASLEYPNITFGAHSPPYVSNFSAKQNSEMINVVNAFKPDILFVGMTAPKQEKWVFENKDLLESRIICSIGAVFDFYAGNIKRAPIWMINIGMEWLYRLVKEPKRMWKRYLVNNTKFLGYLFQEIFF